MPTRIDSPEIEGTLQSEQLTLKQKQVFDVISYFSKIAMAIENSDGTIHIEKPNGFETFLQKLEEARKENNNEDIPLDEYKELEAQHRYDKLRRPLGNGTSVVNLLLRHLSSNREFNELLVESQREAVEIAKKISSYNKISESRKTDFL